jgi:septal ring factor EnvC (AmiA/AmiB activator)
MSTKKKAAQLEAMLERASNEKLELQKEVDLSMRRMADLKASLGDTTNQKLELEKENADLREALKKITRRP